MAQNNYRENSTKVYTIDAFNQAHLAGKDVQQTFFTVDRKVYVDGQPTGQVEKKEIVSFRWDGGSLSLSPDATALYKAGAKDKISICALQVQVVDESTGELVWQDTNMFSGKKLAANTTILKGGI